MNRTQLSAVVLNLVGIIFVFIGLLLATLGFSAEGYLNNHFQTLWLYPYSHVGTYLALIGIALLIVSIIILARSINKIPALTTPSNSA
jgi:hypothetical protein